MKEGLRSSKANSRDEDTQGHDRKEDLVMSKVIYRKDSK